MENNSQIKNEEMRTVTFQTEGVALEERADGKGKNITGYGAVFFKESKDGTEYQLTPSMQERIAPTAFDRTLSEDNIDVISTFNHNDDIILGRISNKSLTLSVDDVGLKYSIPFNADDDDHRKVAQKIKDGLVVGSSFSFLVKGQEFLDLDSEEDQRTIRTITDAELHELGPVSRPAFVATTAAIRSAELAHDETKDVEKAAERHKRLAEIEARMKKESKLTPGDVFRNKEGLWLLVDSSTDVIRLESLQEDRSKVLIDRLEAQTVEKDKLRSDYDFLGSIASTGLNSLLKAK